MNKMANKTLDQIRVAVALQAKNAIGGGQDGGDKIKNYPTMIQNNGLLGALAFSTERKKKKEGRNFVDDGPKNQAENKMSQEVCNYLNMLTTCNYSATNGKNIGTPEDLIQFLVKCTPEQFRRINTEVLAFMNYFRRFAS